MDQPQERTGGSVPNDWGNTLARRWAPTLPRPLAGSMLRMLYVLRTLASADGALRYRDGRTIPLGEIGAACRSDEKDVRRYLTAAIAAGVVGTLGESKAGKATVYVLIVTPWPNWAAAAAVLANSVRPSGAQPPPWPAGREPGSGSREGSSGRGDLNSAPADLGGPRPEVIEHGSGDRDPGLAEATSGDRAPTDLGGPRPHDLGGPRPHQPCITKNKHQEMADVVPQPQDVRAHAHPADPAPPPAAPLAPAPDPPPGGRVPRSRTPSVPDGQAPLLLSVHDTGTELPEPARIRAVDVYERGWRGATGWPDARPLAPDPTGT